jgi:hypothetical protein
VPAEEIDSGKYCILEWAMEVRFFENYKHILKSGTGIDKVHLLFTVIVA